MVAELLRSHSEKTGVGDFSNHAQVGRGLGAVGEEGVDCVAGLSQHGAQFGFSRATQKDVPESEATQLDVPGGAKGDGLVR